MKHGVDFPQQQQTTDNTSYRKIRDVLVMLSLTLAALINTAMMFNTALHSQEHVRKASSVNIDERIDNSLWSSNLFFGWTSS